MGSWSLLTYTFGKIRFFPYLLYCFWVLWMKPYCQLVDQMPHLWKWHIIETTVWNVNSFLSVSHYFCFSLWAHLTSFTPFPTVTLPPFALPSFLPPCLSRSCLSFQFLLSLTIPLSLSLFLFPTQTRASWSWRRLSAGPGRLSAPRAGRGDPGLWWRWAGGPQRLLQG